MMPELGKYAGAVLGAYGVTLALLAGLVALSALRAGRVKRALEAVERETRGAGDGRA
jgi:heme exporter protein D